MAGLSTLQSGPKGSERDQNGQPKCFWPLGTLLGPSGPFWTVSNKNWYFAPKHLCQPLLCPFGAKKSFLSKMVQKGPDGPKMGPKLLSACSLSVKDQIGTFISKKAPLGTGFSACNCLLDSCNCLLKLWYWVPTTWCFFVGPLPGPTMKCVCLVHHPPTTHFHDT